MNSLQLARLTLKWMRRAARGHPFCIIIRIFET